MKYHAFLSTGRLDKYNRPEEKEFMASNPERLREFIEVYWINTLMGDMLWKRMFDKGQAIHFPGDGTIHIEVED